MGVAVQLRKRVRDGSGEFYGVQAVGCKCWFESCLMGCVAGLGVTLLFVLPKGQDEYWPS